MGRNQKLSSNDLPILSQRRSVQYKKQTDKLDGCPASARDDAALFVQGGGDGGGGGERADILESLVDELRLDVRLLRAGGVHRDA